MQVNISMSGLESVQKHLDRLTGQQAREAMALAINDTGFMIRNVMRNEMTSVFDRPTKYIRDSVWVTRAAPDKLTATVLPTYFGGKGIDPQRILDAQTTGGPRADKRLESALRRAGILPNGYQTAIPDESRGGPYPGSVDGNGNLRGAFASHLISYFQASGEQGYKANMTARTKAGLHKGSAKRNARRYFVSYGKLRGGRDKHLQAGIWAAEGPGGVDVQPVLIFIKRAKYKPIFRMEAVARKANASEYLARRLRFRIRKAAGV